MKNLIRVLHYARPYWGYLIIAGASLFFLTVVNLLAPWLIRILISIISERPANAVLRIRNLSIILTGIYLGQGLFTFLYRYLAHVAAWNLVADIRTRIYNHMQGLSLRYYHDKQTGSLMSRTANDPAALEVLIAHAVPDLIINVLLIIGVSIILFILNPLLALFTLLPIPFMVLSTFGFTKRVLPNFRRAQERLAEFNAVLQDNLSGIKEIQAFNQQNHESVRVEKGARNYAVAILHALKLSAVFHPIIEFCSSFGNVIVVGIGGIMALQGRIPLEDVVVFFLYLSIFYQPVRVMARVMEDLQQATAGAERVFEVLEEEPEIKEEKFAKHLNRVEGKIEFEEVNFWYQKGNKVLNNITFQVNSGEMIAIVGPTGVGKSTLISLIPRFYDPVSGAVRIDGIDIREVTLFSLRQQISLVLQDVFLFNGTIADNIAYGYKNVTEEQIRKAAQTAKADEFIRDLPQGYDTIIGERGVRLSGGQKQRLSIARAVLRDTPILIMDEATASVDVETEEEIQQAISKLIENKTIIVIAHRLSTIKKADQILVLENGKIAEQGSHEGLLRNRGLYYRLHKVQFSDR